MAGNSFLFLVVRGVIASTNPKRICKVPASLAAASPTPTIAINLPVPTVRNLSYDGVLGFQVGGRGLFGLGLCAGMRMHRVLPLLSNARTRYLQMGTQVRLVAKVL